MVERHRKDGRGRETGHRHCDSKLPFSRGPAAYLDLRTYRMIYILRSENARFAKPPPLMTSCSRNANYPACDQRYESEVTRTSPSIYIGEKG